MLEGQSPINFHLENRDIPRAVYSADDNVFFFPKGYDESKLQSSQNSSRYTLLLLQYREHRQTQDVAASGVSNCTRRFYWSWICFLIGGWTIAIPRATNDEPKTTRLLVACTTGPGDTAAAEEVAFLSADGRRMKYLMVICRLLYFSGQQKRIMYYFFWPITLRLLPCDWLGVLGNWSNFDQVGSTRVINIGEGGRNSPPQRSDNLSPHPQRLHPSKSHNSKFPSYDPLWPKTFQTTNSIDYTYLTTG